MLIKIQSDDVSNLWKGVTKEQMIQHKLKVDIAGISKSQTIAGAGPKVIEQSQ